MKLKTIMVAMMICFIIGIILLIMIGLYIGAKNVGILPCNEWETRCYKTVGTGGLIGGTMRVGVDCDSNFVETREMECIG